MNKRPPTSLFILVCCVTVVLYILGELEWKKNNKWDAVTQVNFSLSNGTSRINVANLPGEKYIKLVDEFDRYKFKLYKSNASWKPTNECSINILAAESSTELKCKNTINSKESHIQPVPNDIDNYQTQVVMGIKRVLKDIE